MKESNAIVYRFLPQLFLRAPFYSFAGYDLSRLPEVLQDEAFRNAVFLASPGFYASIEKKEFDFDRLTDKQKHTLYKYYNRMCFRATPFGSFSSFTVLRWGTGDQVRLAGNDGALLHLLPDHEFLRKVINGVGTDLPEELMVNPTLYRFNEVLRYTKSSLGDKGSFSFSLQGIAAEKFNLQLFAFLSSKKVSRVKVSDWIMQHSDSSKLEAEEYISFLLDAGAVFDAAQGTVIRNEALESFPMLAGWDSFWQNCNRLPITDGIALADLARNIGEVAQETAPDVQPFYAALERQHISGGPDGTVQEGLSRAVHLLQLLSSEQPSDLSRFIRDFRSRFDQEKVPLLLALDPDAGLHYGELEPAMPGQDMLENMPFPQSKDEKRGLGWHATQQFIFKLWVGDTLRDPWAPLEISDEDLLYLQNEKRAELPLPQTQALMYRPAGEYLVLESSGGVSGASLIGRFSCFSEQVYGLCRELAQIEQEANPQVIFADIAQQSDTHVDNINRRRPIYSHQIPLNVYPSEPGENLVLPGELMLSLRGEELILESTKLNKRIIPHLATAYNFRNNHSPIFRLLCDLQFQGIHTGLSFSLDNFFPGLPFYPRVSYGKVVLSLAKWNFSEADLAALSDGGLSDPIKSLEGFRKKHHLPRHITLGATDQQLIFDLADPAEARFFLQCIQGSTRIAVQEYLLPDRSVLSGKKAIAGQMVAFLAHSHNIYKGSENDNVNAYAGRQRDFLMGSNWLYLKLFCIPRASDEILAKVIFPFIKAQKKRIKKWFFIRYYENGYHLRLRIEAEESDLGVVLVALRKKIESSGLNKLIRDFQGDTYRREIERYGANLIAEVEELFHLGSNLVALALSLREKKSIEISEFDLAILSAYRMICCFFPAPAIAKEYVFRVTDRFMTEFRADKALRLAMDNKFREKKTVIVGLVESKALSKDILPLLKQMAFLNRLTESYLKDKKMELLADLVHMQLNRSFSVKQRQQELLVYYCLGKYYSSLLAREKSLG